MKKLLKRLLRERIFLVLALSLLVLGTLIFYGGTKKKQFFAEIDFLQEIELPHNKERVLVFAPHPDDETIAAAGFIQMALLKGADVKIVLVTDGNKHHLKNTRYQEFYLATAILGVPEKNLVFLNYPDGYLDRISPLQLFLDFAGLIDSYLPDYVLFPAPEDMHKDHKITGLLVADILKNYPKRIKGYQYLVHHRYFPKPQKFAPNSYLLPPDKIWQEGGSWQKLSLPRDVLLRKEAAVFAYRSQLSVPFLRRLLFSFLRKNELFKVSV